MPVSYTHLRQERSIVGGGSICIQVAGFTGAFHYSGDGVDDFHVYVSICVCGVITTISNNANTDATFRRIDVYKRQLLNTLFYLESHTFLHLQAVRENIHYAGYLAQSGNRCV